MGKVMVNITSPSGQPSLAEIQNRYGISAEELDREFGVVAVDPEANVYTVLVDEQAAAKITPDAEWNVEGPFSNPKIEPFGPPQP
jgi:hypothetical protein